MDLLPFLNGNVKSNPNPHHVPVPYRDHNLRNVELFSFRPSRRFGLIIQ